jgi:UDP-glucose 4-epimerase
MILVTGGTGYIGSHTAVKLIENDEDLIILDNLENSKIEVLDSIKKITGKIPLFYKTDLLTVKGLKRYSKKTKSTV